MNASVALLNGASGNHSGAEDYESYDVHTCLDWGTGNAEAWAREAVRVLLSVAILLSNTFIVVAVARFWVRDGGPLGGRAASSFLVLNLAAADALLGLCLLYTWLQDNICSFYESMAKHPLSCMLPIVVTQICDSTSAITIIVIAVDRVMSVSHTARCRNFLTPSRALRVIVGVWLLGTFVGLTFMIPGAYDWNETIGCDTTSPYDDILFWGTVAVILLCLVCCYCRIHRVTVEMMNRGSHSAPRKQMVTKAARMLLLIIAWESCAYFPLLLVDLVKLNGVKVSTILDDITRNLTLMVFLADPYIYAYNNPQTKKAISDFVVCLRRDVHQEQEVSAGHRESITMKKVRQIISTITATSSGSEEEKQSKRTPSPKRNSRSHV